MNIFQNWPHRWFGSWKGNHPSLQHFPRMEEFVDEEWQCPQKQSVLRYLRQSPALIFLFPGAWRTDGIWLWQDGIAEEMEREHLRLPDAFLVHIASRNFEPLPYLETSVETILTDLDWPFTPSGCNAPELAPIPVFRLAGASGLSNTPVACCGEIYSIPAFTANCGQNKDKEVLSHTEV